MNRSFERVALGVLLLLFAVCSVQVKAQGATTPLTYGKPGSGRVLVIGCVTKDPKYNYGRMQGIAEYVLEKMSDMDVDAIEVFTVDAPEKMARLLRSGRVDWVSATPFNAVRYTERSGGEILLAKSQGDRAWYQSVFFARADSGIKSMQDLIGKTIAFEKPDSTSAYYLPVTMLKAAGLPLVQLDSVRATPPDNAIGYVFSGDESNSTLWVHKRLVDAAAFSDADWNSSFITPQSLRNDMTIFERSRQLPRSVEIVSSQLPDALKKRLKQILLNAPADPDAQSALNQYYWATGFSELTAEMHDALESIRTAVDTTDSTH